MQDTAYITSSISVSCTDVGFLITCCSLHLLPSDSKHSLSLQFPHLPSATPPLFSIYLLIEFLVVYRQIICSWCSNYHLVSKATFVSSCSDMTRKLSFVIEVSNHKSCRMQKSKPQSCQPSVMMSEHVSHLPPPEATGKRFPPTFSRILVNNFKGWGLLCFSFSKAVLHSPFSPPNPFTSEVPAPNPNLVYAVSWVRLDMNHGHSIFRQRLRNTELPSFCWAPNYP